MILFIYSSINYSIFLFSFHFIGNTETERLIKEADGECHVYTVDLCDRNAIYKAAEEVKKNVGKVCIFPVLLLNQFIKSLYDYKNIFIFCF